MEKTDFLNVLLQTNQSHANSANGKETGSALAISEMRYDKRAHKYEQTVLVRTQHMNEINIIRQHTRSFRSLIQHTASVRKG